jgi:hypothetical protein
MIALIDDDTATRFYNEIDNASEEDRQQMADALLAWGEQKQKKEREELETHFSKLFTDDSYYQQINDNDPALSESLDPEATAKRASIHAYLEHQLNRPIDTANFEPERDAFAMQAFGQKNLNDGQLFDFIRGDYDWQKQRTEAINDLQMQAVGKAITDSQLGQNRPFVDGMTEVFNQWQQKYPELVDGKNDAAFLSQGYKLYYDTINDLDTVRPQASKALSTLTSFTQGNATDEDMQSLANDFVGAPPEDRQKIYKYVTLAAQAGQIDRAGIEQFAINMGQAFTRGFDFVPQGTLQMQEAGVNNWLESIRNGTQIWVPADGDLTKAVVGNAPAGAESDAWRQATVPEAETLIQSGQNVRESFKVVRELRNVAKTGVDPIRPVLEENSFWGTAERGAYGLSGSIPLMGATAVNPFLGVLAYQSTEYDRIMLENPDINPQFAQGLALVEGAANAAIDRVQLSSISGRLPMFGRYLDRIASDGVRRTVKIGANVVEQNLQEGAQDLIAPVLETAVASLREDMPDKNFTKLMDDWSGQRAETFFATLPLALIGGGVATYRDIKNPSAELNATKLRMAGFGKDQVTFIQRAENPEEYDARIKMEWEKRTPENIKAGEQEVLNTIEKARTPGELDARMQRVTAPDGSEDIVVTSPDGKELLRTKSEQAALEAVRQHNEAQLINERNAVSDMVDYFRAQDPANVATIEAPRTVQQELDRLTEAGDSKGIANLNERIRFAGIPEGSDLTTYNILGEANVETTAEGVFRGVIKLRENSRPEDAFEEINHVFVRKALAEGRTDLDSLRGWLQQTSEATGETYAFETETDIIENIAKVGMDYAAGRIEETSLPASFVDYIKRMLQVFKETMARAIKLKDAFATGKIDSNFESFLAESVGLNQQTMVDTTRERVGGELTQGTFNYSIGQQVLTDTAPFKGWFGDWKVDPTTASKVVDSDGKPMVVFHGTQRADRVGDRFRKSRATSGPMAFFTNDPAIASSYSTNKRDTSAEMPSDYAEWFKYKGKGMRSPVAIDRAWWSLSPEERAAVNERIYTIGYSDWYASEGPIVADSQSIMSRDSIDYELRQARGNGLRALVEMWLSSGSLFNQEERFLEVLQAAGVKGATLDDPNAARSAVYPVYLSIKNPLDTASIPGDVVSALEQAGKRKRAKQSAGKNPDGWDKNTISGNDWMAALKEDMAKGTTHAWTRIPDWVTETLSSLGYDGIKDTGGKNGGVQHQVWIPFNETQVKSATGNRGTFDPTSANINYSIGKIEAPSKDYFSKPDKDFVLGQLSPLVLEATGKSDKPVVLKVSVVGKNKSAHGEIPDSESAKILQEAISSPDLLILDQPAKRPNNWHFVRFDKSNQAVLVEMEDTKDTHQIVGWMAMRDNSIAQKIERAKKEGGRVLITGNDPRSDGLSDRLLGPRLKKALDSVAVKFEPKNYSIASQSEIDRVNRALGGMNRGPDERLKVYQRAKQKFSKVMAWNSDELAAMADTGSDDSQIRRTQILQGLGELDAILKVLPPEVRGRVGGYTVLANIAPMDVFKDGVKVSEAKNMDGAIISAWKKEGQNIGQAGKQVSLPPGYTAKENLASKRADKALADFFRDRIKKIDTELEKVLVREYTEAITKAVKQSRPKAGDNGVRKSTLGAETQKFADMVQRATLLDDEATPKRMAAIEAALANPDATAEDISAFSEEWSILNTFGDLDNRSSETLAQGLDWLKGQLQMGREAWRIKEQARIDEQRARAAATIEWLGKGTAKKRNETKTTSQLASDLANHYLLSHANFEQFVTAIFPPEIAAKWSERLRKADEASQASEIRDRNGILNAVREGAKAANMSPADALLWLKADQKNAVAYLEGRMVKDERIAIDLAQKIVTGEADRSKLTDADIETLRNELAALPADTQKEYVTIKRVVFRGKDEKLTMSRGKAIQYLLSWNQPDVQIKMRKEGWTDESAADLKALVNDPVSRSVVSYLQSLYGKGAGIVNPVYSRMFGMTMPQVKNYAPTRFLNAKDSKDIGLDGSPTATGTTPGFAKSRVTHSAKIAPEDALTVAQGHIAQQAHWVHFAELAREFRAILSNPEVRESIKQTQGESVLKDAELWADQLEQRGGNKAREVAWINAIIGTAISGKAVSLLGFNLKTFAMNLDNTIRFALALDMKQVVSALSNPATITEDIQTVWESNAVQNRLQGGATAEARFLLSRYAGKPNFGAKIAEASMTPHNWLDSAATSISSAIVYRANLNDALAAGMPENLAKQAALDAASQAIYRFAQPVSFGQKSIVENSGGMLAKTFFLFMSDPRLKTAILADAARGLATGRGDKWTHIRRILVVETMAVLSHVVSNAFRDTFSDDDDDEIWNLGGFAKAMLLAPLQGFFFAGTVGELAISKLTGQKTFNSTTQNPLLSAMEQAVRAGSNLEDAFNLDDPDAMFKEWNNIFRSMALSPSMAAPAVLLNMIKPALGLYQNATTED